jgi:manganese-dependent inorganic pyrophosphatase
MLPVYVTGHRNPDLDSISSAIGYAELKRRQDPHTEYVPVRLGEINAQTAWALERSGATEPELLPHVHLRVCDVMEPLQVTACDVEPVRNVGLRMAELEVDLAPVVNERGALAGVLTERDFARQYIRESRGASNFDDRPVRLDAIAEVLGGEVLTGDEKREVTGRLWVAAMEVPAIGQLIGPGDIAVVGDRVDAQRRVLELDVAVLVISHASAVETEILEEARRRNISVVSSPLDSYVTGRLIGLAVPCGAIMSGDPPAVSPEDLLTDVSDRVVDLRAVFAVDDAAAPIGIVTRSHLVSPPRRRVVLVDHAEQGQSVPGVEQAHIVEILDHHHIGSIETRVPVRATFDPVGSTATLVVERFRAAEEDPRRSTAMMLLAAVLSDTVILSSPTTTTRDETVVRHLEQLLDLDARAFGMEMFRSTSDVSDLPASVIVARDAKEYTTGTGAKVCIAQVETVGPGLLERREELLQALEQRAQERSYAHYALMITDIVSKCTELLVAGNPGPMERAFGVTAEHQVLVLPGVMSRKKQVAPRVLAAL